MIDEAWDLLGGGFSGEFIAHGYRRARKYNGAFVSVTQSLLDFYRAGDVGEAVLENSAWTFMLRQKRESVEEMKKGGKLLLGGYFSSLVSSLSTPARGVLRAFRPQRGTGNGARTASWWIPSPTGRTRPIPTRSRFSTASSPRGWTRPRPWRGASRSRGGGEDEKGGGRFAFRGARGGGRARGLSGRLAGSRAQGRLRGRGGRGGGGEKEAFFARAAGGTVAGGGGGAGRAVPRALRGGGRRIRGAGLPGARGGGGYFGRARRYGRGSGAARRAGEEE